MTDRVLILIPPSEGKTAGGTYPPLKTIPPLTKELLKELQEEKDQAKLLGVKGAALEQAINANRSVTSAKTLPAMKRYSGVVYQGIDYETLKHKKRFDERVRIVSGLFGLVEPDQPIPDYKLKIEKLQAAQRWKPLISEELKNHFIIDLLPLAHKKAISYEKGKAIDFVREKNGKKVPAGHFGKFIKGRFVRWLIENDITDPKEFKKFKEEGFIWTSEYFLKKKED
ncbi:MAG: YaaA family protein [Nanoarchaeota archaeon]|nr:YaaA family protein [Nanoarchaeota archaeon]